MTILSVAVSPFVSGMFEMPPPKAPPARPGDRPALPEIVEVRMVIVPPSMVMPPPARVGAVAAHRRLAELVVGPELASNIPPPAPLPAFRAWLPSIVERIDRGPGVLGENAAADSWAIVGRGERCRAARRVRVSGPHS